jgi:hypothetical protein
VLLRRSGYSGYSGHSDSFFVVAGFFICGVSLPLQEKNRKDKNLGRDKWKEKQHFPEKHSKLGSLV